MRIGFYSYMGKKVNGSYAYLINRQLQLCKKYKLDCVDLRTNDVDNFRSQSFVNEKVDRAIIYTTFGRYDEAIAMARKLKADEVILWCDTATLSYPIKKQKDFKIVVPSLYNYSILKDFDNIYYHPHITIDLISYAKENKDIDFLTVGISEHHYDRKGHFWNIVAQKLGFKTFRVGEWGNWKFHVDDEALYRLYGRSKFLLAMSHIETPYLPLIESVSAKTPVVYLDAHEFHLLAKRYNFGIPIRPSFVDVRDGKLFIHYEVDPYDFLKKMVKVAKLEDYEYKTYQTEARKMYEELNNEKFITDLTDDKIFKRFSQFAEDVINDDYFLPVIQL